MRNGKIVPKYADFGGPSKTKFTAKFKLDQDKLVQVSSNNGKFAVSKADSVQNNSSVDVKQYYRQKLIEHLNGWQFKDIEISDSPGKLYLKNGKFVCAGGEHGKWVVVGRGNYQINFSNGTIKLVFTEQSPGTVNSDSDISFPRSRVLKVNNVLWDEKHNNVQFVREKKFQSNVNSLYAKYKAQIEQQ
ncbi:hypothetical protein [Lacticaseibacillus songhuajiangensis]|uniref:hypothetical protein n=1 Tax=Lacticaseibacillus songhuajiangensis TaxID=1296539 RepID=UPI000F773AAD|nr:hypothetical protein [Lacticaseibacillus songhuajiangensis]